VFRFCDFDLNLCWVRCGVKSGVVFSVAREWVGVADCPGVVFAVARQWVGVRAVEIPKGQRCCSLVATCTCVIEGALRPKAADDEGDPRCHADNDDSEADGHGHPDVHLHHGVYVPERAAFLLAANGVVLRILGTRTLKEFLDCFVIWLVIVVGPLHRTENLI